MFNGKAMALWFVYLVSGLMIIGGVVGKSSGLTLELVHRNSLGSPFFQGDLTNVSTHYLSRRSSKIERPYVGVQVFDYMVKIGIGTLNSNPPYQEFYLVMDTGSRISWIQCQGCNPCFNLAPSPFAKNNSRSFQRVRCEDNACVPRRCDGWYCIYYQAYVSGEYSKGMLARETFSFTSNSRTIEKVGPIVFGCGLNNDMVFDVARNNIAGVMGLGWGSSFVNQIASTSGGRFSYCLPVINGPSIRAPTTYLRFGSDIPRRRSPSITKLSQIGGEDHYYAELQGVSLNGRRIIDARVFGTSRNGGRCVIDSGTTYSELIQPAYDVLVREVQKDLETFRNLTMFHDRNRLCYNRDRPAGYRDLPTITFHFQAVRSGFFGKSRADLVVRPDGVFRVDTKNACEFFCLAMDPAEDFNVIGSFQQTNQRIIYDTKKCQLLFSPEDCSRNG